MDEKYEYGADMYRAAKINFGPGTLIPYLGTIAQRSIGEMCKQLRGLKIFLNDDTSLNHEFVYATERYVDEQHAQNSQPLHFDEGVTVIEEGFLELINGEDAFNEIEKSVIQAFTELQNAFIARAGEVNTEQLIVTMQNITRTLIRCRILANMPK